MIGDLVVGCIETDIVGEATYKILCKVTDINYYGDVRCEALEPFPDELDWQDGDDFSWIEAIPLTPEILEKNLATEPQIAWCIGWNKKDDIHIEIKREDLNASFYGVIGFVHQLQHALRLCGINKNIVL